MLIVLGFAMKLKINNAIDAHNKSIDIVFDAKGALSIRSKVSGARLIITAKSDLPAVWEHEIVGVLFNAKSTPSLSAFAMLSHLKKLEELMLAHAPPMDHSAINLKEFRSLKMLSLKGEWIDRELNQIALLPNLESLVLDSPTTESRVFETLPTLPALHSLQLVRAKLDREAMLDVSKSPVLSRLELVRCSGMENCGLSQLNSCSSLRQLSVLDCDGRENTWDEACRLSKLSEFISDSISSKSGEVEQLDRAFGSLRSLFLVRIDFLDDSAINMLRSLPNLNYLRIHNSRISENAVLGIAKLNSSGIRIELQYSQIVTSEEGEKGRNLNRE